MHAYIHIYVYGIYIYGVYIYIVSVHIDTSTYILYLQTSRPCQTVPFAFPLSCTSRSCTSALFRWDSDRFDLRKGSYASDLNLMVQLDMLQLNVNAKCQLENGWHVTSKCGMLSAGRNPVPLVNIKIVGFEMNVRSPSNRITRYCEVLFHSHIINII